MSLSTPPKSGNSEFKAVTARGLQPAICSLIVDMGTLEQEYHPGSGCQKASVVASWRAACVMYGVRPAFLKSHFFGKPWKRPF